MKNIVLLDETIEAENLWNYLSEPTSEVQKAFEEAAKVVPVNEDGEPYVGTFTIKVIWNE